MGAFSSREEVVDFDETLEKKETPTLTTSRTETDPYRLGKIGDTSMYGNIKVEGQAFTPPILGPPSLLDPTSGGQENKVFSTASFTNGTNLVELNNDINLSSGSYRTGLGYHRSLGQGTTGMISGEAIRNREGQQEYWGSFGVTQIVENKTTLIGGGKARFDQNINLQSAGVYGGVEHRLRHSTVAVRGEHDFYGREPRSFLMAGVSYRI